MTQAHSAASQNASSEAATCPFGFGVGERKTKTSPVMSEPAVLRDQNGVWQIRGFETSRQILRGDATRQAGFGAEMVSKAANFMREPILYMEGEQHHTLRGQTAKFFTPATTQKQHRGIMESLTNSLVNRLESDGRADLSQLSLELAVGVAAHVIGLTNSNLKRMGARIGAFANNPESGTPLQRRVQPWLGQLNLLSFYWNDVRPAINARRKQPQDDVISHILGLGYKPQDILGECVTYGAAGMLTTREFISVCAWHLLERPALRARYLEAGENERQAILSEILRLEPVIGTIKRRATAPIRLEVNGEAVEIAAGDLMHLSLYDANADASVVGENPHDLCPARPLPKSVQEPVLSFGDGHHRCPGSFIALLETDIFLHRLLSLPVTLTGKPHLSFNPTIEGYELRDVNLRLEGMKT
jgi:cytochrome P450